MNVRLRFFARARDLAGVASEEMVIPEPSTVADLRRRLVERYPALAGFLDRCAIGVADEFARDDQTLPPGAEVAVLPPVSGG